LRFEAKDLAIKLFAEEGQDGILACGACDSTGPPPKPGAPAAPKPCPAPSKPACPPPSKKAGARGEGAHLAGLVALRQQLHSTLSQAG
jgi:hypothetical protein